MDDDDFTASLAPTKRPLTVCVMNVLDSGGALYKYWFYNDVYFLRVFFVVNTFRGSKKAHSAPSHIIPSFFLYFIRIYRKSKTD